MKRVTAWRAALTVAALYGNFLIFAQFAFVELLRAKDIGINAEKALLGGMALLGITGGFLMAWRGSCVFLTRCALAMAAASAALAPSCRGMGDLACVAAMSGLGLGGATVGVAARLRNWCGLGWVGLGVGLGYAVCNLPFVFSASATQQAWIGAVMAVVALLLMPSADESSAASGEARSSGPLWAAVLLFTALVWLDSAAFFIIQHTQVLKSATWGEAMLWRNAALHLTAACVAGWWLARKRPLWLLPVAWSLLALAALGVNQPGTRAWSGWIYPVAVSFYSVALIAWPGWFGAVIGHQRAGWRAAWLFAVAGWIGSANGIGMAEALQQVPPPFVLVTGLVVFSVLAGSRSWRSTVVVLLVCGAAGIGWRGATGRPVDAVQRGHQVYLQEGCIHCHSQYVRPHRLDESAWGPADDVRGVLAGRPVLIGNRRQGPDLARVGARRSPEWLRRHFRDPRAFAPASLMPSYAHLEADGRLEDLVSYLRATGVPAMGGLITHAAQWRAVDSGLSAASDGRALFMRHCAVCHGEGGRGDGRLAGVWPRPARNLVEGPFIWSGPGDDQGERLARVIKFGVIGTDMPGHETLTDGQVDALVSELLRLRRQGD